MIAYDSTYVSDAQRRLGAMLDVAVNGCGCELEEFYQAFLKSRLSTRFGAGDPAVVSGRSGAELALDVLGDTAYEKLAAGRWMAPSIATEEYWAGWALAFYQWASGQTFAGIERRVPIGRIRDLYAPYHEMDIRQFVDKMNELCLEAHPSTSLKEHRLLVGLSQRQLAEASHVPLRTLQQYEQRQKNINHARADYLIALARVLSCDPRELLEYRADDEYVYALVSF